MLYTATLDYILICKRIRYTHIVQYVYTMMQYQLQNNVSVQQAEHVRKLLDFYLNIVHFFFECPFPQTLR